MPDGTQPVYIRVAKCQEVVGVHRSTIYRWAREGLITIHKRGGISLISRADFDKIMSVGEE